MKPVLTATFRKRFPGGPEIAAQDLAIGSGVTVLFGASGSGKTTLLRCLAGLETPDTGEIKFGEEVWFQQSGKRKAESENQFLPSRKRGVGFVPQDYALFPHLTVAGNVRYGLPELPAAERAARVAESLRWLGLDGLAHRLPCELSGGQQQRVALARAIVVKPSVLLLDEPLSNLDANLREEMRFEIRRLHDEFRITTVYVTHDQSEAMATSDRIAVMHAGRIEQVAAPHLLYTKPRTRFVAGFIGRTNLLEAHFENGEIGFDGFAMKAAQIDMVTAGDRRTGLFSVRPQGISLHAKAWPCGSLLPATITGRVYLGESWDYTVAPANSGISLRVAAPPLQVLDVGDQVWLEFDPRQMALVE